MQTFTSVIATLACLGLVVASPVELNKRKAFSVGQIERGRFVRNGPASVAKTFRKYGKKPPANILAAAAVGPNGTVPATPSDEYDSMYLSPVDAGGHIVNLDFDTGSADLYVHIPPIITLVLSSLSPCHVHPLLVSIYPCMSHFICTLMSCAAACHIDWVPLFQMKKKRMLIALDEPCSGVSSKYMTHWRNLYIFCPASCRRSCILSSLLDSDPLFDPLASPPSK